MIVTRLTKPTLRDFVLKMHTDRRFASRFLRNLRAAGWAEVCRAGEREGGEFPPGDAGGDILLDHFAEDIRERTGCERIFLAVTLDDRLDPASAWHAGWEEAGSAVKWAEERWPLLSRALAEEGVVSEPAGGGGAEEERAPLLALPVSAGETCIGVLAAAGEPEGGFDARITRILKSAAFLLGQSVREVVGEDRTNHVLYAMIQSLAAALDARDAYTRGHADRVAMYSMVIANEAGVESGDDLPGGFRDKLRLSALFHDIGKIGVRDCILNKPDRLEDEEYDQIKRHPIVGAEILKSSGILDHIIPGVLYHHERIDGSGYPIGLQGDEIPLVARIIGLADTFDAITSDRAFHRGEPYRDALDRLVEDGESGLFPADLVRALIRAHERGLLGYMRVGASAPGFAVEEEKTAIEGPGAGFSDRIPVLPAAVAKLNAMVRDPECDVGRLAEVIRADEGLVARVLKYANSAFYGLPGRIGTIQLAVTILGMVTLRNLVIVAALAEMARSLAEDPKEAQWLWDHGIDVGVWSRALARRTGGVDPEEAFTAGLIHDIGKHLILRQLPPERSRLRERLLKGREGRSFEKESVGFDHAQVGGWAVGRWKFPETLVQAVRWHHEPTRSPAADPEMERLIGVVHVADILARGAAGAPDPAALQDALLEKAHPEVRRGLDSILSQSSLEELLPEVGEDLEMARSLFGGEVRAGASV